MKRRQWIINIFSLGLLIFIVIDHEVPQNIYEFFTKTTNDSIPLDCEYSLEEFDFHYRRECYNLQVIMIGNSITRWADWNKLLNRTDVINRGISGDDLLCMCERVKYLKGEGAKIWFIQGGFQGLPGAAPKLLFEKYKSIIEFVKGQGSIPVVNLVIYTSPKVIKTYPYLKDYKRMNALITELNGMLLTYVKENNIDYIDLNRVIADKDNTLKDEFTPDGVHINESAYREWANLIVQILIKNKI